MVRGVVAAHGAPRVLRSLNDADARGLLKVMSAEPELLNVRALRTVVDIDGTDYVIVDGVDLDVHAGQSVALVGESGSGKSVTALSIARLNARNIRTISGQAMLEGEDLLSLSEREMRARRGRDISMVFQEPMTSLNPVLTVFTQLAEIIRRRPVARSEVRARAIALLESVGISTPEARVDMYPQQLSGGMRQRVMLAIAIAAHPRIVIADEPTTALDVTTQAQILDLLRHHVRNMRAGMLLITHDMGVVARYADSVNVMYSGCIVERAPVRELFARPAHPYTRGLLKSIARLDRPRVSRLPAIEGLPPQLTSRPAGCPFQPRCAYRVARCAQMPPLAAVGASHEAACCRAAEVLESVTPDAGMAVMETTDEAAAR